VSTLNLPKGYHCKKCGEFKEFSTWVYAHWHDAILSMCEKCGTKHTIIAGVAELKEGTK